MGADRRAVRGRGPPGGRDAGARADVHGRGPPLRARARHRAAAGRRDPRTRSRSTATSCGPSPTASSRRASCAPTRARRRCGSCSAPAASPRRTSRRTRCARTSTRTAARSTRCAGWRWRWPTQPPEEWPHALLLLGDQVYADEVHPDVEDELEGEEVADYDDYVKLYIASWGEPVIRWLLSTVPSAMIFDDHDVHDDWNTSIEWVTGDAREGWWRKRIVAAFESYLIYQHLGNLSPEERGEFELYEHLRTAPDPTPRLREFAKRADEEVKGTRWSFCRDIGPARVVMIDSRAGRVLDPGNRSMVDHEEWEWITDARHRRRRPPADRDVAAADHGPGHALARGLERDRRRRRLGQARSRSSPRSCARSSTSSTGRRSRSPSAACASTCARSAPATAARRRRRSACSPATSITRTWPRSASRAGSGVESAVWQAVCSPFRNPLDSNERRVILAAWTRTMGALTRALARRAGVRDPDVRWRLAHDKPWFNNQVAWLELEGRRAKFVLQKALPPEDGEGRAPYGAGVRTLDRAQRRLRDGLKTQPGRWGHDQVANRWEPLRTT